MMASAWPFVAEVGRPQIYSGTTRLRALRQSGHARFAASTALALAGATRPGPPAAGRLLVPTPKSAPKSGEPDGDADKADKIARMKKLLGAADKRLEKAQAELQERDRRIQALEARLK